MGYHNNPIPKGIFGQFSKIREEMAELSDAFEQDNKVMVLVELSDLFSSIRAYLDKNIPGITLQDLIKMADATDRAFTDGTRK